MISPSLTRAQVRDVDRIAIEDFALPGIVLMENAGLNATRALIPIAERRPGPVVIVCGGGNNGGDGYVIARQLVCRGLEVRLYSTKGAAELSGDAATNRAVVDTMGLGVEDLRPPEALPRAAAAWEGASVLVDALLGTGFQGELRSDLVPVVMALNAARAAGGAPVVAIDLPSGLDCDNGLPADPCVLADYTFTFVARKRGFDAAGAHHWTGEVRVFSIGAPPAALQRALASD